MEWGESRCWEDVLRFGHLAARKKNCTLVGNLFLQKAGNLERSNNMKDVFFKAENLKKEHEQWQCLEALEEAMIHHDSAIQNTSNEGQKESKIFSSLVSRQLYTAYVFRGMDNGMSAMGGTGVDKQHYQ